jgi:hypothetical protein
MATTSNSLCDRTESRSSEFALVYDLDRDQPYRNLILGGLEDQWEAYRRGECLSRFSEGRISSLFFDPFDAEPIFEVDEGSQRSFWVRRGNPSSYAAGRRVKVEHVVFHAPVGNMPVISRIWIGPDEQATKTR